MSNFKFPNQKQLTDEQQTILNEENQVAIFGGAGTGKTIVSIHRHIENWKKNIKSFLITYTHTLTHYFEEVLPSQNLEASKNVDNIDNFLKRLEKGEFSEIEELIIDEAQDVPIEIHKKLKEKFKISYSADDYQILYPYKSSYQSELLACYPENKIFPPITQNFRNSYNILKFVDSVFPNRLSNELLEYSKIHYAKEKSISKLIYSKDKEKLESALIQLIKQMSSRKTLGILVPTKSFILYYRKLLTKANIEYSSYYYRDNNKAKTKIRNNGVARIHLTPFKSSKGLEFDNVIIPDFQDFAFWKTEHKYAVKENDYYVGMTRAKNNLFLLTKNLSIIDYVDSSTYIMENI